MRERTRLPPPRRVDRARRAPVADGRARCRGETAQRAAPGVAGLSKVVSTSVARDVNDELAELPALSGGRLRGLALLPLQHPEEAADELRRAAALGLPGAQLLSNAERRPLDGPEYHALFAAAAECDLPLVIHPTLPIDRTAVEGHGLLTTLGFLFDTTACAARLVLGGVFDRHPGLKLLLPHAGSTIPYLLGRFEYVLELMGVDHGLSGRPSEHLRKLYLDCVCESPRALRLAVDVYGAEGITYGTDEPFWSTGRAVNGQAEVPARGQVKVPAPRG
ncbi:amidohydrolase family protein [Blastococcus sp. PRF04-17]|uniref:amidohydrolase family protein n=1 Tax=Blastococcus sp. PRF04-17 TaxID=2933797 RepID=UPI001FF55342|nr:amidohydrolase family protein [Blastococcus sp. PRF04-17]UOY03948.1 amidohydrolase family protein [Blastococcus sp. PRF04-17]